VLTVSAVFGDPTRDEETPPASQIRVRFALLGSDAQADAMLDAVLDATDVQTDAQGIAHVTLIAPSKPTTFSVRASNPRSSGDWQGVTVNTTGTTSLRVQPSYTGERPISKWTATAKAGVSCSDLPGNPPPDGDFVVSAKPGAKLVLTKVPVRVNLAVTVRAGHYVGGCVNVLALSEGDDTQVLVYASDRALNLAATNLSLSFGASDAHPAFDKLLQSSIAAAETALLGDAKNDVAALLEDMREAAPSGDREEFDVARTGNGWDSALENAFGKGGARRMRDPALRWLSAGVAALNAPDALLGKLTASGSRATFTPSGVGGVSASDAGLVGPFAVTWSADSNDTVLLGMDLSWQASRLVSALALAPARAEFPEAQSVERALSLAVDCAEVGQVLVAAGTSPGAAFTNCDQSCVVSACESALVRAWNRARDSSGAVSDTLSLTATAKAAVGDDARATALTGSWVGQLSTANDDAQVSGALSAK